MAGKPIHVLVIDDSAVVRQMFSSLLTARRGFNVETAADPVIAHEKIVRHRPDVIVLDVELPRMDGLTFLRQIMSEDPLPVVICSALAERGSAVAIEALEAGAVDIVTKPKMGVRDFIEESAANLIDVVKAAAHIERRKLRVRPDTRRRVPSLHGPAVAPTPLRITTSKVVAIGASTGGTEAIRELLQSLPPDAPGLVIVQHMPEQFTAAFARRLDELAVVSVKQRVGEASARWRRVERRDCAYRARKPPCHRRP
jgi:two-component system chemotaxis response regulator CheB